MKITLTEEQANTLEVIKDKRQYGVFFDMSVGKTATLLSLIEYLKNEKGEIVNALVLCPAVVANTFQVWQNEIEKWDNFNDFNFLLLKGTKIKREKILDNLDNKKGTIVICSNALLGWFKEVYGNLSFFNLIIVDESSDFKTHSTNRFKFLAEMTNIEKQRIYLLSGTPTPNDLHDIWSQIYLLDRGLRLGKNISTFRRKYCIGDKFFNFQVLNEKKALIYEKIKDICVFAEGSIKLPNKYDYVVNIPFNEQKKAFFKKALKNYIIEFENTSQSLLDKKSLIEKLSQLCNGGIYIKKESSENGKPQNDIFVFDSSKILWIKKYLKEHPEENVLIFYTYKFDKARLLKEIKGSVVLDKPEHIKEWNKGNIRAAIISPYSFKFGGNMQYGGYTIIWYGLKYSLENYLQSNKRVHRPGQTHFVKIYHLFIKDTHEYKTLKRLKEKEEAMYLFLKSLTKKGYKKEDITKMFKEQNEDKEEEIIKDIYTMLGELNAKD